MTEATPHVAPTGGPPREDDTLDLVWGIEAIDKLIGRNYTQTYHLVDSEQLPFVKKVGKRYYASRRKLIAFFEDAA